MSTVSLVEEIKIHQLLPGHGKDSRLEASGVVAQEDHFVVVFDNVSQVARIDSSLTPNEQNGWLGDQDALGHEDITYSSQHQRYYLLIEAVAADGDSYHAEVVEYDRDFRSRERHPLPFEFECDNKGFEGLAYVQREEQDYLLALCEGNQCKGGREGRQQGNGRIQIFQRFPEGWRHVGTLKLPETVRFTDYSSLDISDGHVVVVSQESSRLWLGTLDRTDWRFVDPGIVWHLPRGGNGKTEYCHAEGVSWMAPDQIAVVSDRRKKGDPKRCAAKDQSLHIFRIP